MHFSYMHVSVLSSVYYRLFPKSLSDVSDYVGVVRAPFATH